MQAAVAPEPVKVPDFHVNYLQVVGAVEPAQDATAIEPALPDDFVDDVGKNEAPKRSLVKQAHQFAELPIMRRAEPMSPNSAGPFRKTRSDNVTKQ